MEANPLASAVQDVSPGPIAALGVKVTASEDIDVTQIEIAASGSIDESAFGDVRLLVDADGDGAVSAADSLIADGPAPQTDDGSYLITPAIPIRVDAGSTVELIVAIDSSPIAPSVEQVKQAGKTITLALTDALSIQGADAAGNVFSVNGLAAPIENTVTLSAGEHVLISEVAPGYGSGATASEFVELVNPTGEAIDLSNYYLTDFTNDPTLGEFYWKLPTGADFGPAGGVCSMDFVVRFPAGATLAAGQVIVVAIDGEGFKATHGSEADYCLRNAGTTTSVQMLTWDGQSNGTSVDFVAADVSGSAGLTGPGSTATNNGERVCLFVWDGVADLIQDVDICTYGGGYQVSNGVVDKSPGQTAPGAPDVQVDSIADADRATSTFQPEQEELWQMDHRAPNAGSVTRVDFTEGAEVKTGGNGIGGHDETSEDLGDGMGADGTFAASTTQTPGALD